MSLLGTSVMGMNCHKCGTLLPAEAAYCPSCGAPRSEIDHFVRETEPAGNPDDPGSPIQTVFYACGPSGYVGRTAAIGLCGVLTLLLTALTVSAGTATAVVPRPLASPAGALLVTFDIQVDAGAADYVHRAAQAAIASKQDLIIVMNTPGGLLSNMVQIINSTQEVQNQGFAVYT